MSLSAVTCDDLAECGKAPIFLLRLERFVVRSHGARLESGRVTLIEAIGQLVEFERKGYTE